MNAIVEAVPNIILGILAVIISKATLMRVYKLHPAANDELRAVVVKNARASIFITSASLGGFICEELISCFKEHI